MEREIVLLGDPVLRKKAKSVKQVDARTRKLIDDMVETMHAADGLGLAAPQVGVSKRVLVAHDGEGELVVLVNPTIVDRSGRAVDVEGCLSMPGLQGDVPRATKVSVRGLDRAGRTVSIEAEGLLARVLQHEIDHLNGVLFIDHTDDLWWLERTEDEAQDEAGETVAEREGDEAPRPRLRKVATNVPEVEEWFAEERSQQRQRLARKRASRA